MQTKFRPIVVDKSQLVQRTKSLNDKTPSIPLVKPTPIAARTTSSYSETFTQVEDDDEDTGMQAVPSFRSFTTDVPILKPIVSRRSLPIDFTESQFATTTSENNDEGLIVQAELPSNINHKQKFEEKLTQGSIVLSSHTKTSTSSSRDENDLEEQFQDFEGEDLDFEPASGGLDTPQGMGGARFVRVAKPQAATQGLSIFKPYVPTPRPLGLDKTPRSIASFPGDSSTDSLSDSSSDSSSESHDLEIRDNSEEQVQQSLSTTSVGSEDVVSPKNLRVSAQSIDSRDSDHRPSEISVAGQSSVTLESLTSSATQPDASDATNEQNVDQGGVGLHKESSRSSDPVEYSQPRLRHYPVRSSSDTNIVSPRVSASCVPSAANVKKVSSGTRLSLRRQQNSVEFVDKSQEDDNENPWFQEQKVTLPSEEAHLVEGPISQSGTRTKPKAEGLTPNSLHRKRIKLKRLGRLFRKATLEADGLERNNTMSSVNSSMNSSLTGSTSTNSSLRGESNSSVKDVLHTRLEQSVRQAMAGKESLEMVLNCTLLQTSRPGDSVLKLLYKYLSTTSVIDSSMSILLGKNENRVYSPLNKINPTHVMSIPHRNTLVHLIVNASSRTKRAYLLSGKARNEMIRFFMEDRPKGDVEISRSVAIANALCKIMSVILREFPTELAEYISNKRNFLTTLIKNHIHVPEVVSFIVQLCAADALANTGEELVYGDCNAGGILLLSKERVYDTLADIFVECCNEVMRGRKGVLCWQMQAMSLKCMLELGQRALVTPRFNRENCSYSNRYMKSLNNGLDYLNLFSDTKRVERMLKAAYGVLEQKSVGKGDFASDKAERNNGMSCILALIEGLFSTMSKANASKSFSVRRAARNVSTEGLEKVVCDYMDRLCKLMRDTHGMIAWGRVRTGIIEVFMHLFGSKSKETWFSLCKARVADKLLSVLNESRGYSIIEFTVVKCLTMALMNKEAVTLHDSWLTGLGRHGGWLDGMKEKMMRLGADIDNGVVFDGVDVQIGYAISQFEDEDREERLKVLVDKYMTVGEYEEIIERRVRLMGENGKKACGGPKPEGQVVSVLADAKSLAAKLNDVTAV